MDGCGRAPLLLRSANSTTYSSTRFGETGRWALMSRTYSWEANCRNSSERPLVTTSTDVKDIGLSTNLKSLESQSSRSCGSVGRAGAAAVAAPPPISLRSCTTWASSFSRRAVLASSVSLRAEMALVFVTSPATSFANLFMHSWSSVTVGGMGRAAGGMSETAGDRSCGRAAAGKAMADDGGLLCPA